MAAAADLGPTWTPEIGPEGWPEPQSFLTTSGIPEREAELAGVTFDFPHAS